MNKQIRTIQAIASVMLAVTRNQNHAALLYGEPEGHIAQSSYTENTPVKTEIIPKVPATYNLRSSLILQSNIVHTDTNTAIK